MTTLIPENLTPRRLYVVKRITEGATIAEIAEEMCLSLKGVEYHKWEAQRKLRIISIALLTQWALATGLIKSCYATTEMSKKCAQNIRDLEQTFAEKRSLQEKKKAKQKKPLITWKPLRANYSCPKLTPLAEDLIKNRIKIPINPNVLI